MNEWQPIQTAPRGTPVLCCGKDKYGDALVMAVLERREDWWLVVGVEADGFEESFVPTHWMALPSPPDQVLGAHSL